MSAMTRSNGMAEQVPDEPTLAEYEQYIRKQVAAEPYSTYARGVVRDLLAEVDRLRSALAEESGHVSRLVAANEELLAQVDAARAKCGEVARCGRCQGTDMAHLGTGYYECRGCGHGWDGPHTDAPADIR